MLSGPGEDSSWRESEPQNSLPCGVPARPESGLAGSSVGLVQCLLGMACGFPSNSEKVIFLSRFGGV